MLRHASRLLRHLDTWKDTCLSSKRPCMGSDLVEEDLEICWLISWSNWGSFNPRLSLRSSWDDREWESTVNTSAPMWMPWLLLWMIQIDWSTNWQRSSSISNQIGQNLWSSIWVVDLAEIQITLFAWIPSNMLKAIGFFQGYVRRVTKEEGHSSSSQRWS